MSTPDQQEKLKEEAKAIRLRLETLIKDTDPKARMIRTICIYAGILTETLIEYEEPDVVMEQAFHRVAELLRTDPEDSDRESELMPIAYTVDHDTELGRHLARNMETKLPKGLDDVHEIAIALVISDFPVFEAAGFPRTKTLRLLIETVIMSLTFEMATQDFCDLLIEEFMADDGNPPSEGIFALAAIAGYYLTLAETKTVLPDDAEKHFTNVMVRESVKHGTPGQKNWYALAPSNDLENADIPEYIAKLQPSIDEFFALIGLEDPLGRAVCIAKSVGRMVAVITVEDVGQMHPSIAKSLAKTGLILGAKYRDQTVV